MKKAQKFSFLLLLLVCFQLMFSTTVHAEVSTLENIYLEINHADDVICIPQNTQDGDPIWTKAGITDVKTEKKHLTEMGGKALLYDPSTKTLIRVLCKTSKDSSRIFNLGTLTKDEREEFYQTMIVEDDKTSISVSEYSQNEIPFFRLYVQLRGDVNQQEIIYGTVVNGTMIYYDLYSDRGGTLDESFQKSLVAGTHFTKQYTKEEYETMSRNYIQKIIFVILMIIVTVILLVIITKMNKKRAAKKSKLRSDALSRYYTAKKEKQAQGFKNKLLYENSTTYSEQLMQQFCKYTFLQKRMTYWCVVTVLYLFITLTIYFQKGLGLQVIFLVAAALLFIYFQYCKVEKYAQTLWIPYKSNDIKTADFHFYEDYFTLSGIQHMTEYPYLQILSINETKDFIYLYYDKERGVYISKDGFKNDIDVKEFVEFIQKSIKVN